MKCNILCKCLLACVYVYVSACVNLCVCVLCYVMHLCESAADAMSNLLGLRARKQCVFVFMSDECVCVFVSYALMYYAMHLFDSYALV